MASIFFSYAHNDADKVQKVKEALELRGYKIWVDKSNIQVGISIPQAIQIGINSCDFLLLFMTKNAENSIWIKRELANFLMRDNEEKENRILPLKFEDCHISDFYALLKDIKWADFTREENFDAGINEIVRRISETQLKQKEFSHDDYERMMFSIDLAIRAGNTAMMFYNSSIKANSSMDERRNAATDADETAQARVIAQIKSERLYDRETIISEEEPFCHIDFKKICKGYTWVIDPLDGTNNFISRIPIFCSAIGILKNGNPFIGVLYDPVANEVYYSMSGQKSQVWHLSTGETSYVSVDADTEDPKKASLGTHISSREEITEKIFSGNLLLRLSKRFKHVRMLGCGQLALAWVASGRLHAFFQLDTYLWDQVAGIVILKNAGGYVKNAGEYVKETGSPLSPWNYQTRSLIATANEKIEKAFSEELKACFYPTIEPNAKQGP